MRRNRAYAILIFLIFSISFGYFFFTFFRHASDAPQKEIIAGSAVFDTAHLKIDVICEDSGVVNLTGSANFSLYCAQKIITEVSRLQPGWFLNLTIYGSSYPSGWAEPEPASSETGEKRIRYFKLSLENISSSSMSGMGVQEFGALDGLQGPYDVFFNITKASLGDLSASDLRLFYYSGSWQQLEVSVTGSNDDTFSFSSVIPDLGKFLIAGKIVAQPAPGEEVSVSGGGGGGGSASRSRETEEEKEECEEIWECNGWSACTSKGVQKRLCRDVGSCKKGTRIEERSCAYPVSCNDSIKNQNETDIDCGGGECSPCIDGKACISDEDCIGLCSDENICYTPEEKEPIEQKPDEIEPEGVVYKIRYKHVIYLLIIFLVILIMILEYERRRRKRSAKHK